MTATLCLLTVIISFQVFMLPEVRLGLLSTDTTKHIKRLPDGNNRIIAIEVNTNKGLLCIINCYMPSMDSGSSAQYTEHLDIIESIIDKYNASHKTVVCGDFNGTLLAVRSNPHDRLLRTSVRKMHSQTVLEAVQSVHFSITQENLPSK